MDDLDRSIAKRSAANPRYPAMLAAEIRRQRLIYELVAERNANHLTQAAVAEAMIRQPVGRRRDRVGQGRRPLLHARPLHSGR